MDTNIPKATMTKLNRCRNYLQVLFLSDICTADGKFIERRFLNTTPSPAFSTLAFPREQPSSQDWKVWRSTWYHLTSNTGRLKSPLGDWINTPSVQWTWFLLPETSQIANVKTDITHIFERTSLSNTRSGDRFGYLHSTKQTVTGIPISVLITSVDGEDASITIKSSSCNTIPLASESTEDFWTKLRSGGGEWMWKSFQVDDPDDLSVEWIVQAMANNTSLWVTDGSHYSQRGPDISAAAWIVTDTMTDRTMSCSFVEFSPDATSYRAETLGLYSIHVFIKALHDHFQMGQVSVEICCDNDAALKEAQGRKQRISAGRKCADVFRGIQKLTHNTQLIQWKYTWVKAHMDNILEWAELSREQQLNVRCDEMAKKAAEEAISTSGRRNQTSATTLLPHELIAVYVENYKQTTDPAEPTRYSRSKQLAGNFLTTEVGWTTYQFDLVDWDSLHKCLQSKPEGFKTWLAKQHSNFCATRLQMKRWYGADDSSCPSCGSPDERAEHLCKCPSSDRRKLLIECTTDLVRWMSIGDNTHPDLITWVEQYILGGGKFPTVFDYPTPSLKDLVQEQNTIGWRNFMEGRISKQFLRVQFCHLIHANSRITAESWTKTFISKILHITHSQWIFRNFMLHGKTNGLLRLQEQEATLLHIKELSLSNKNDLPEESRFLLEFDLEQLRNADYDMQCYWTAAVSAARQATFGPQLSATHMTPATHQPSRTSSDRTVQYGPAYTDQTRSSTVSQHRPSPALRYATEDSNRARKPD
jgi:ribonuclease HI